LCFLINPHFISNEKVSKNGVHFKYMNKKLIATITLITVFSLGLAFLANGAFAFSPPSDKSVKTEIGGRCGDNICGQFEQKNPDLCPSDCEGVSKRLPQAGERPESSIQQEEFQLPKAPILPDSFLYPFKRFGEKIVSLFIFGAENKAKRQLYLAEKRLAEAKKLSEKKAKLEYIEKSLDEYQKSIDKSLVYKNRLKKPSPQLEEKLSLNLLRHQKILLSVRGQVPEDAKEAIAQAMEKSRQGFSQAIESVAKEKREELKREQEELSRKAEEKEEQPAKYKLKCESTVTRTIKSRKSCECPNDYSQVSCGKKTSGIFFRRTVFESVCEKSSEYETGCSINPSCGSDLIIAREKCGFAPPTCGDGICGPAEKENPNLCPTDCQAAKKECQQENKFCGGIAGIVCCNGLVCEYEEDYPDASGVCVKERKETPELTYTKQDGNICSSSETCSGSWIGAPDTERCCSAVCIKSEPVSQEEINKNSPFGFLPAIVVPPNEYGVGNPYDFAVDIGVKWDRSLLFTWMATQPNLEKREYQWVHDRLIENAPNNINLMANILIGSPDSRLGSDSDRYYQYAKEGSFLPKDEQAYVQFVKAVIERYDGDGIDDMPGLKSPIKYWQVDNEPPHGLGDYAEFLKITYIAIKEADPEAKVIIGGVPGMPPVSTYLESFNRDYLPILDNLAKYKKKYFDIFDFHWYGDASGDYQGAQNVYKYIKQKIDERGISPSYGYWITEMGTYSGDPTAGLHGFKDYPFQTEKQQAADLTKRYVYSLSAGIKKVFMAYGLKEGFKGNEGYFDFTGIIYDGKYKHDKGRGVKKLAYYTYKKMVEVLEGSDWNNIETVRESDGIYIYKFTKKGKPIWVAWNDNSAEKKITISRIGSSQVKVIEAVPKYESGKDMTDYSSAFNTETKSVKNDKLTITLGEIPLFIEGK
jgi:hypothetical protein